MGFDSVGSWSSRLGTQPLPISEDTHENEATKPKRRDIHRWWETDTLMSYNQINAASEATLTPQKSSGIRRAMGNFGKGLGYALGVAAASYGLGTLFTWASQVAPAMFARTFLALGTGLKFVGKVIPASFAYAIESVVYTFPKWLFTQGVPAAFRYSWEAISIAGSALGKAASWVGRNLLTPVLDTTWKVITTIANVIGEGALWLGKPAAKFIWKTLTQAVKVVEAVGIWLGENLFLPLIEYGKTALVSIGRVIGNSAAWLGKNVVTPALRVTWQALSVVGNALLNAGAKFLDKW